MMGLVNRYKTIVMKNDDLTLVTYFEYVKDWEFESQCAGKHVSVPERTLAKTFVNALRPIQLQNVVRLYEPSRRYCNILVWKRPSEAVSAIQ
jgi:hypothetical protein